MTTPGAKLKQLSQHCLTMQGEPRWNKLFSPQLGWETIDSPYKTRGRLSVSGDIKQGSVGAVSALPHKEPTQLLTAKSLHLELKKEETQKSSNI